MVYIRLNNQWVAVQSLVLCQIGNENYWWYHFFYHQNCCYTSNSIPILLHREYCNDIATVTRMATSETSFYVRLSSSLFIILEHRPIHPHRHPHKPARRSLLALRFWRQGRTKWALKRRYTHLQRVNNCQEHRNFTHITTKLIAHTSNYTLQDGK